MAGELTFRQGMLRLGLWLMLYVTVTWLFALLAHSVPNGDGTTMELWESCWKTARFTSAIAAVGLSVWWLSAPDHS